MEVISFIIIVIFAVWLQKAIYIKWAFHKLDYSCRFSSEEAQEGDELLLVETVHNKKFLPLPWLKVDIHSSRWLDFAGAHSVVAHESRRVTSSYFLKSYEKVTRKWKLKCLKRGVFTTENVTLQTGEFLGTITNSIACRVDASLVVFPGIVNLEELFVSSNYIQGEIVVRRWIIDDPFTVCGSREYMPGDPMNRIHWQATAREGKLMVKKNEFTSQMSLTVILNIQSIERENREVVDRERIETGIKVTATLIDGALRSGIPVRLITNGCTDDQPEKPIFTGQASGRQHVHEIMKVLARLQLRNVRDFNHFLADVENSIGNDEIVIITAYTNEEMLDKVGDYTARGNRVRVFLLDSFENMGHIPVNMEISALRMGE